jgi:hypothetical protein
MKFQLITDNLIFRWEIQMVKQSHKQEVNLGIMKSELQIFHHKILILLREGCKKETLRLVMTKIDKQ